MVIYYTLTESSMLIELKVTNFRSINSTQILSTVAAPIKEENLKNNIFSSGFKDLQNLVKSVVIYGANAAGKSNIIEAIDFVQNFVRDSAKESQAGETIENITPFLLDKETPDLPSEFELLFVADEILYEYGFALTSKQVVHEWLYAYPQGKPQRWFERIYDEETNKYDWYLNSKKLPGRRKFWQESTRDNALFLSTAVMLNSTKLQPVLNWISRDLVIFTSGTKLSRMFTVDFCKDIDKKQKVLEFLQAADLNIVDFKSEEEKITEHDLPDNLPDEIKKDLLGKARKVMINFLHTVNETDDSIEFPLKHESEGTKRLFAFAGPLIDIFEKGRILFIDELDNSLHPSMVRFIIELIHNPKFNRNNAQVIFTTHDSSTLDNSLLRRDQVWFVEKDKQQSTQLYPLTDFKPRQNEALQKGYLEGRYGALPFISELNF
jgi:hypothetical protein